MHRDFTSKTCSLAGASDLTVLAPIRKGLVPALDTFTYKSRVKRVLRALHTGRQTAHEYDFARVLSDAVERVGRIHSVRIAVLEPQDAVLLAVTFDGAWESYVRVIWQKVARLLDLIFCNTVDYVPGWNSTYEQWGAWLRSRQVETPFLYAQPGVTAPDVDYLRMIERRQRRDGAADLALSACALPPAEIVAASRALIGTDPTDLGMSQPIQPLMEARPPAFRQGLRAAAGLYRLADLYPPGTPEGGWLLRAAQELLPEFRRLVDGKDRYPDGLDAASPRFDDVLAWFQSGFEPVPEHRLDRPAPDEPQHSAPDTIQAGILDPYPDVSHGVLLLLAFDSREALAGYLAAFQPSTIASPPGPGEVARNIAVTVRGLRLAGLTDAEVEQLPEEFVVGMEKRSSVLGDVRGNHPARWHLPVSNWHQGVKARDVGEDPAAARVPLASAHVLVQMRLLVGTDGVPQSRDQGREKLLGALEATLADGTGKMRKGVRPLSLQWMHRLHRHPAPPAAGEDDADSPPVDAQGAGQQKASHGETVEHFGFGDGGSDPVFRGAQRGLRFANHVHVGEALCGYENAADPSPAPADTAVAKLLHNGSFLVVRKLRQDLEVLDELLARAEKETGMGDQEVLGHMMGRWPFAHPRRNDPLVPLPDPSSRNDFNYDSDPAGLQCPVHAHIRRANPRGKYTGALRSPMQDGARAPRLFRRSLSYGLTRDDPEADAAEERGLVFMAYNASIGEQFEVVQHWLSGGNSAGGLSAMADPFLGVPESGRKRFYRFQQGGQVRRIHVDGSDVLHEEPRPLVRLEWGGYFFTPSTAALKLLADWPSRPTRSAQPVPWSAERGERLVAQLLAMQASQDPLTARLEWKSALEDPEAQADFSAASIWAAIRAYHGGVLQTAYGVLVASDALVKEVLHDRDAQTSVSGYRTRMAKSFGEIFLGLDQGDDYRRASDDINAVLGTLPRQDTFTIACQAVHEKIRALVADTEENTRKEENTRRKANLPPRKELPWELTIDVRELVDELLARFCEHWFGLADGQQFERGGFLWHRTAGDDVPRYPGHFMAPSRYFFQPHPGEQVERLAAAHGQAMLGAMKADLPRLRKQPQKPVLDCVFQVAKGFPDPDDFAARTLIGVIMGFVPTVDGTLRRLLAEWLREGTFWSLRNLHGTAPAAEWSRQFDSAVDHALQARAMPEVIWRTATSEFMVGSGAQKVRVRESDVLVLGLVSATQERLERGRPGTEPVFGGARGKAGSPPTHACPARLAADAMLRGFLTGLVTATEVLRPGIAPMTLTVHGRLSMPVADEPADAHAGPSKRLLLRAAAQVQLADLTESDLLVTGKSRLLHGAALLHGEAEPQLLEKALKLDPERVQLEDLPGFDKVLKQAIAARTVPILCLGDSWLADIRDPVLNWVVLFWNLLAHLREAGYEAAEPNAEPSRTLENMATNAEIDTLVQQLVNADPGDAASFPRAIIIGGGGNDIVKRKVEKDPRTAPLFAMLKSGGNTPQTVLDRDKAQKFIDGLCVYHDRILKRLTDTIAKLKPPVQIPILIHAYDHPRADGRENKFGPGPWLQPVFHAAGITDEPNIMRPVMATLIDMLNKGIADLIATKYAAHGVHHVGFPGVLAKQPGYGNNYQTYWADELHATRDGYKILADLIVAKLRELGIRP